MSKGEVLHCSCVHASAVSIVHGDGSLRRILATLGAVPLAPHCAHVASKLGAHHFLVTVEVDRKGLNVVVEAKILQGPDDIVPVYGLSLFLNTLLVRLRGYEGDELRDALLDRLLSVLRYLSGRGHARLHDAPDVGDGQEVVLLTHVRAVLSLPFVLPVVGHACARCLTPRVAV
eukprot:CAMPEP_0206036710 /NCGR_PEP_ID=MMETSP1466-20131121/2962_1 /ASSEMBLY_ACC=CAM_ASM_001126 /TAXON_ID=44452 /ORGANISM="Pavlova gyrans, Strain CCMP608" /LENGTH=173 /DNA_ID=CAMNT_0053411211 /DNA_START=747 /DNA_END=1268 /DNA_ORIENTATION=-